MLAARLCGDIARQTLEGLTGFFVSWDRRRVGCGARYADQATGTEGCNLRSSHPSTTAPTLMYPPTIPPFASTVSRLEAECTQRCAACDFPRRRRHSSALLCECELLSDGVATVHAGVGTHLLRRVSHPSGAALVAFNLPALAGLR